MLRMPGPPSSWRARLQRCNLGLMLGDLVKNGPVITDGAWGTEFQALGLEYGQCPDAWNLTSPGRVEKVARSYVKAGSRIILTNTFRSNRIALDGYGLSAQCVSLNRHGAALSRQAAGEDVLVFGSIGPSGKMLVAGETTGDELYASFAEQAEALASGGVHGFVVETMSDLGEAVQAVKAARGTGLPVIACMVFDSGRNKDRTMMGVTPEQCGPALLEAGADFVGANCGVGIEAYIPVCARLAAACGRPVWIKANAGLPELQNGVAVYRGGPDHFSSHLTALVDAGAKFIGGCCGTTPAFITALRDRLG